MNIGKKKIVFYCLWALFLPGVLFSRDQGSHDPGYEKFDLGTLEWKLWGYRPYAWQLNFNFTDFAGNWAEYSDIPVTVPGSVRKALLKAGIIPDWNYGLNNTASEWVEHRHWLYTTRIPDDWLPENGEKLLLHCAGLDGNGVIMINGREAGTFDNTFLPYTFNVTPFLKETDNTLVIVFFSPPQHLGQIGFTSKIKDWKSRFYYGWDWIPRLVQTGIWDRIWLSVERHAQPGLDDIQITADASKNAERGVIMIKAKPNKYAVSGKIKVKLTSPEGRVVFENILNTDDFISGKRWDDLKVKRWWPNGMGKQPLYKLDMLLLNNQGEVVHSISRQIGFRNISWLPCEGAAKEADPWICSVNNKPFFLQGINWTPIRPDFADLTKDDYWKRLKLYRDLGINVIRVWGGGFPEKQWLYDFCDEMGILVWQDFPLSSSGIDNYPPEGAKEILVMTEIVRHYVLRLEHHPSLLLWCGGNELYNRENSAPITIAHPMIFKMKEIVNMLDPLRRFTPSSPSGPNISANRENFGSSNNWEVHGPWTLPFTQEDRTMNAVEEFWKNNDALFISEAGVAGAMSAEMIKKYAAAYNPLPASYENPVWRNVNWWIDWDAYLADHNGAEPGSLEEYVAWSQKRQSDGLTIAVRNFKNRFPSCGGFIVWMGHDSYPCFSNTSILDFEGNPKPVAYELSKIWKNNPEQIKH